MPQLLKLQNFTVSADGYGAGNGQSLQRPFGHADPGVLVAWAFGTASFPGRTQPGGSRGLDDHLARDFTTTSAQRSWGATSSARSAARGRTTSGRAGGATSRPSTPPSSC